MPFARAGPKAGGETVEKLRGERDLGHQDKALPSGRKGRRGGLEINLRLAGARYAFEQSHRESAGVYTLAENRRGVFLRGFKGRSRERRIAGKRRRFRRQRDCLKRAFADQIVDDGARTGGGLGERRLGES